MDNHQAIIEALKALAQHGRVLGMDWGTIEWHAAHKGIDHTNGLFDVYSVWRKGAKQA